MWCPNSSFISVPHSASQNQLCFRGVRLRESVAHSGGRDSSPAAWRELPQYRSTACVRADMDERSGGRAWSDGGRQGTGNGRTHQQEPGTDADVTARRGQGSGCAALGIPPPGRAGLCRQGRRATAVRTRGPPPTLPANRPSRDSASRSFQAAPLPSAGVLLDGRTTRGGAEDPASRAFGIGTSRRN